MEDYWIWSKKTKSTLTKIHGALAVLADESAKYVTACTKISIDSSASFPATGLKLWLACRQTYSETRASERKLSLIGYEAEVALSIGYFTYLSRRSANKLLQKVAQDPAAAQFSFDIRWVLGDDRCTKEVPLNPDRLGVSVVASNEVSTYELFSELAFYWTSGGIQFLPTRSTELCNVQNPNWIVQSKLVSAMNAYLWSDTTWPLISDVIPTGLIVSWSPYMEIVGDNVSVLSKTRWGRHASRPLLERMSGDYDIAVGASLEPVTAMVNDAIAKQNGSKMFHPEDYHDGSAKLEGGPIFIPPYIDFIVGVYWKDQGGKVPLEWYVDLAGKARIRAAFLSSGAAGSFKLAQVGSMYDVSWKACWKNPIKDACFGIGDAPLTFRAI